MAKLGITVGANMWPITGLAWVLHLVGALPRDLTGVPPGARWTFFSLLLLLLLSLPLLELPGDGLYRLHHAGGVHLVRDSGPGDIPMIQVTEYPGVVVPGPLPGVS